MGMDKRGMGIELMALRLAAGLTQRGLAERMGRTTQGAIARAEAGGVMPRVEFIDRWAVACGRPLVAVFGGTQPEMTKEEREAMVARLFGPAPWNPFDRGLTDVERQSLAAEGLTPAQFGRIK